MKALKNLGLFQRIFISFLLVITVVGITLYFAGTTFGPIFLEQHLQSHGNYQKGLVDADTMLSDLKFNYQKALAKSLIWSIVIALFVAGGLSLFVSSQIASPLRKMQKVSSRISKGKYSERLDVSGPAEVGQLAQSFNAMAKSLEESESQRRELVRNLAHELRTPLSNLKGYLEGLEDGIFEPNSETFEASKQQILRLETLLDDLALVSRVEAKQEQVNQRSCFIGDIFEDIKHSMMPAFDKKGVLLSIDNSIGRLQVFADPARTGQILINLCNNALKHTASGGELKIWAEEKNDYIEVNVKDNGEGMTRDVLEHIFTRFYRADPARSDSGSGIGLTIAKYFVEAQGGNISVSSEIGKGSHFCFTLKKI